MVDTRSGPIPVNSSMRRGIRRNVLRSSHTCGWVASSRRAKRSADSSRAARSVIGQSSGEFTDESYVWPDGLEHYLEVHDVRLPSEFVTHALGRLGVHTPTFPQTSELDRSALVDNRWW